MVADLPVGENLQDHVVVGGLSVHLNQSYDLGFPGLKGALDYYRHNTGKPSDSFSEHNRCHTRRGANNEKSVTPQYCDARAVNSHHSARIVVPPTLLPPTRRARLILGRIHFLSDEKNGRNEILNRKVRRHRSEQI